MIFLRVHRWSDIFSPQDNRYDEVRGIILMSNLVFNDSDNREQVENIN